MQNIYFTGFAKTIKSLKGYSAMNQNGLFKKEIQAELCVIGGGLAGICTAVAAARCGISVVLMQERPVLGGNASSEIRMWVCGAKGSNNRETGLLEEIALRNIYLNPTKNWYVWQTILHEVVLREPNITLLLNTTCTDAEIQKGSYPHGRQIKIVSVTGYQMTSQTNITVKADYFADCSGDSVLAPLTGADFSFGREGGAAYGEQTHISSPDAKTMGNTCLIQGRQTTRPVRFQAVSTAARPDDKYFENRHINPYSPSENYWYLELGGEKNTILDAEAIGSDLTSLAIGTWDYLKNRSHHDMQNWELDFLGFLPGKRESRRMTGEYVVTQNDIMSAVQFPDTVAFGGWPLDDHEPAGFYHPGEPNTSFPTPGPYPLPYRALYSKNVDNLFFAGRNISMTHLAMSSIRVMATCALLGQAVGTASAIASKHICTPHDVYLSHLSELQTILMQADCFLPNILRPVSEICLKSELSGGTEALRDGKDRPHRIYNNEECGCIVAHRQPVSYKLPEPAQSAAVHIVFDSDLDRTTLVGDSCERTRSTRANVLLDSPDLIMPATLVKSFVLEGIKNNKKETILNVENNHTRAYHVPISNGYTEISLTVLENWGGSSQSRVFSFDF